MHSCNDKSGIGISMGEYHEKVERVAEAIIPMIKDCLMTHPPDSKKLVSGSLLFLYLLGEAIPGISGTNDYKRSLIEEGAPQVLLVVY